jgi:hypothetical protein
MADIGVDLPGFEAHLQVIVDGLVRNFVDEGEIGNSDLLLLRSVKRRLLDISLARVGSWTACLCLAGIVIALGPPTYTLVWTSVTEVIVLLPIYSRTILPAVKAEPCCSLNVCKCGKGVIA